MRSLNALILFLFTSFQVFAVEPSAVFSISPKSSIEQIQVENFGSLFYYYEKKEYKMLFVAGDLTNSYTITLSNYLTDLKVFTGDDAYFITYWTSEKFKKVFNIVKANSSGIIKKKVSDPQKNAIGRVAYNGEDIMFIELKRKQYIAHRFSGTDLKKKPEMILDLPDVGSAEWAYVGTRDGIMRFYGFIATESKENPVIYFSMIDKAGKLVKERLIEIPLVKGKQFAPLYYYRDSGGTYSGPMFGVIQSPHTDDIFIYTYYMKPSNGIAWNREGLYFYKIKVDMEELELVYQKDVPFLNGTDVSTFYSPYVRLFQDDYIVILYKEKEGGVMSGKYYSTTAILDPEGETLAHEMSNEVKRGTFEMIAGASDLNDFLKNSTKKNKTNFTDITKKIGEADPDADIDITRFNDQWLVIQHNKKTGKIKFYKV